MNHNTIPSASDALSLEETIARLKQHDVVEGVLTIGTTSADRLTPASDYDLVIVVNELPAGLEPYGVTHVDGRITDLLFVTAGQVEELLAATAPMAGQDWLGRIARWFQEGDIAFDRCGRLEALQQKVNTTEAVLPPDSDGRGGWWRVNYNLAQTRRMLATTDPVYLIAAEMRMALYAPTDLLFHYFDIRNLVWNGDKDAVRYLLAHDPDYLSRFRAFIVQGDRDRKMAVYEDLARRTVAPVGDLWQEGITALAVRQHDLEPGSLDRTLNFWHDLIRRAG